MDGERKERIKQKSSSLSRCEKLRKHVVDRRKEIEKVYYLKIGPVQHGYKFQHISSTHPINVRPPDKTIKNIM